MRYQFYSCDGNSSATVVPWYTQHLILSAATGAAIPVLGSGVVTLI